MEKVCLVGVDVSARTLAVIVERDAERGPLLSFANDRAGHRKLIALVTQRGRHARVVLEATGNYSLDLALALHRAKRVEVMVANPRALSQFAGRSSGDPRPMLWTRRSSSSSQGACPSRPGRPQTPNAWISEPSPAESRR